LQTASRDRPSLLCASNEHSRRPTSQWFVYTLGFVIPVAVSACDVGVVPEDWVRPGVSVVVQRVLQQVQNGSLIVLHDGACGGQDVAATTASWFPNCYNKVINLQSILYGGMDLYSR